MEQDVRFLAMNRHVGRGAVGNGVWGGGHVLVVLVLP